MINPDTGKRWRRGDVCPETGRVFKQYDPRKKSGMAWFVSAEAHDRARRTAAETYHRKKNDSEFVESERERKRLLMRERRQREDVRAMDRRNKQSPKYKAKQAAYSRARNSLETVKERRRSREKSRVKSDPIFKLRKCMRSRLYQALLVKRWIKDGPSERMIGCTYSFLKSYLEARFKDGMSWGNYGSVWHVDHVIPLASAKTKREIESLCRYTNLAPEFAAVNIAKGSKQLKQMPLL